MPHPKLPSRAVLIACAVDPSEYDWNLATKYEYPVVVPGGKPYVSNAVLRCPCGGGRRVPGQVIILRDDMAERWNDHISPVEDDSRDTLPAPEPEVSEEMKEVMYVSASDVGSIEEVVRFLDPDEE